MKHEKKFKNIQTLWGTKHREAITLRYYKFNRYRTLWSAYRYVEMRKKTDRVINSGRSKMVESGHFENETWGALHKAWKGYVIAINKNEHHKIERYARIIQELQHDLGLPISSFPNVGMTPLTFYATRVSKLSQTKRAQNEYDSNTGRSDNSDNQGSADERLTDNGHMDKHEYLTDEKSQNEYLEDDFNAGDRFTS
jgi:hypothetical protein